MRTTFKMREEAKRKSLFSLIIIAVKSRRMEVAIPTFSMSPPKDFIE
jgi:hypothetical protein